MLLTFFLFINQSRICDIFLAAYGLYRDIWAPVIEAGLNIGLSIGLGYVWGISGILTGVIISLIIIVVIWKPFFLFRSAFAVSPVYYFRRYLKIIGIITVSLAIFYMFDRWFAVKHIHHEGALLGFRLIFYATCSLSLFLFFEKKTAGVFCRMINRGP
jgi:hypothetical protein